MENEIADETKESMHWQSGRGECQKTLLPRRTINETDLVVACSSAQETRAQSLPCETQRIDRVSVVKC